MTRFSLVIATALLFAQSSAVSAASMFGEAGDGVPSLIFNHETRELTLDTEGLSLALFHITSESNLLVGENAIMPADSLFSEQRHDSIGHVALDTFTNALSGLGTTGFVNEPIVLGQVIRPDVTFPELLADIKLLYSIGAGTPNHYGDLTSTLPYEHYESDIEALRQAEIAKAEATAAREAAAKEAARKAALSKVVVEPVLPAEIPTTKPADEPASETPSEPPQTSDPEVSQLPEPTESPVEAKPTEPRARPGLIKYPINRGHLLPSGQIMVGSHENDSIPYINYELVSSYYCDGAITPAIDFSHLRTWAYDADTLAAVSYSTSLQRTAVPEPASLFILLAGMMTTSFRSRHKELGRR